VKQLGMDLCNITNCAHRVYFYEFGNSVNGVTWYSSTQPPVQWIPGLSHG